MSEATALAALKTILGGITPPTGKESPNGVWVYPTDHASIDLRVFPVIIVSQAVNTPASWGYGERSTWRHNQHDWVAEMLLFLAEGAITNDEQAAENELLQTGWTKAFNDLLKTNNALNDTVQGIGDGDGTLFDYQVGHIDWWQNVYWGIRFELPITQSG